MYRGSTDLEINMVTNIAVNYLIKHKNTHIEEHAKQIEGWQKAMEDYNQQLQSWANDGGIGKQPSQPSKPPNYVEEYDLLINMLNLHADHAVTVGEHLFDLIYNDNFGWKGEFLSNSIMYSSTNNK